MKIITTSLTCYKCGKPLFKGMLIPYPNKIRGLSREASGTLKCCPNCKSRVFITKQEELSHKCDRFAPCRLSSDNSIHLRKLSIDTNFDVYVNLPEMYIRQIYVVPANWEELNVPKVTPLMWCHCNKDFSIIDIATYQPKVYSVSYSEEQFEDCLRQMVKEKQNDLCIL